MSVPPRDKYLHVNEGNWAIAVQEAGAILQRGGVVLHATETVYGLATRWDQESSLKRVAAIKHRNQAQPFSIMVSTVQEIVQIIKALPQPIVHFLERLFPAPVTVLSPRTQTVTVAYWNQFPYLGFRYPDHRLSVALVQATGHPLITTSANLSGGPAPRTIEEVPLEIQQQVDLILDSGPVEGGIPSTIIRLTEDWRSLELVREGPIPLRKILSFFSIEE